MSPGVLAAGAVAQLQETRKFFEKSISALTEEDSSYAPKPEMMPVAAQVAHVGLTIHWFCDAAFTDKGFDMNFEKLDEAAHAVKSLTAARELTAKAFERAVADFGSAGDDVLGTGLENDMIMQGAPRIAYLGAMVDHTAHHRGYLAVYARLLGKVPPMPYM